MKYFVIIAEFLTGKLLKPDGTRFVGYGEPRLQFDSEAEARAFAKDHFDRNLPHHECTVIDESGREIELLRPVHTEPPPVPKCKPWWRLW